MAIKLYIPIECRQKLAVYVETAEGEIGGLFTVKVTESDDFIMTDLFLFEQEASSGGCELDAQDQGKFLEDLIAEGREDAIVDLKGWWHSHANMGVFWSGTDTSTQEKEYKTDYLVSLVTNKKGEMKAKLNTYYPIPLQCDLEPEVAWTICVNKAELVEEVKQKVRKPAPKQYSGYQGQFGPHYQISGPKYANFMSEEDWVMPRGWQDCPAQMTSSCPDRGCLKTNDKHCTRFSEAQRQKAQQLSGTPLGKADTSKLQPIKTKKGKEKSKEQLQIPSKGKTLDELTEAELKELGIIIVNHDPKEKSDEDLTEEEIKKYLEGDDDDAINEMYKDFMERVD